MQAKLLIFWYIASDPLSQLVLKVLKSLHISYICWYRVIVLSPTVAVAISSKQPFPAKLLPKPDTTDTEKLRF